MFEDQRHRQGGAVAGKACGPDLLATATGGSPEHHGQVENQHGEGGHTGTDEDASGAQVGGQDHADADQEADHEIARLERRIAADITARAMRFHADLQQGAQQQRDNGEAQRGLQSGFHRQDVHAQHKQGAGDDRDDAR